MSGLGGPNDNASMEIYFNTAESEIDLPKNIQCREQLTLII